MAKLVGFLLGLVVVVVLAVMLFGGVRGDEYRSADCDDCGVIVVLESWRFVLPALVAYGAAWVVGLGLARRRVREG